jgi:uncharacterized membrane protein YeiH
MLQVPLPHLPNALPDRAHLSASFFRALEFTGIILGALGGALAVRRDRKYRYDFMGVLGLGLVSGVGGGIARDVLLADGPPLALQNPRYLVLALLGAALGLFFGNRVGTRMNTLMLVVDAAGLGLFTVAGSTRALSFGLGFLPSLLLGVTTAVGGGSLRDVLSGKSPAIFHEGELYALVSACAATVFLLLHRWGVPINVAAGVGSIAGFAIRLLAVRFGWRTSAVAHLP